MECTECNLITHVSTFYHLVIWSRVFWLSVTWDLHKALRWSKSVLTFDRWRPTLRNLWLLLAIIIVNSPASLVIWTLYASLRENALLADICYRLIPKCNCIDFELWSKSRCLLDNLRVKSSPICWQNSFYKRPVIFCPRKKN